MKRLDAGPAPRFLEKTMFLEMFKAKLHRIRVTDADLDYAGSISLDPDLLERVGMLVNEKVQIYNINNGARFETYVIEGKRGARECTLNGAAARMVQKGDLVIVVAFAYMTPDEARTFQPRVVVCDENNEPLD